ncbi:armadillo-type protein [Panaeolus papilionaceus]|nr:armadillo-type protein [Panaeolus papilionaceus]
MDEALSKIRPHVSSSLPHQKTPANLLVALEATFKDQNTEPTPTAYFAAILTTLDGSIQKKDLSLQDGALLPAELYLLALIAPFVSQSVMCANLNTILSLTAPLFPALTQYAPALRSQLSLYDALFQSLETSQLDVGGVRQAFASILQLCVDPRPKVRKKAADVIKDLLSNPPAPLVRHPYAKQAAEWFHHTLRETSAGPFAKSKSSKKEISLGAETAIHALAALRPLIPHLPPDSLPAITNILLSLPRLGNTYLSQSAYATMSDIFDASVDDISSNMGEQIGQVLKVVITSPPSKSDFTLSSSWVQVLGDALMAYKSTDPELAASELYKVWKSVWNFMDSSDTSTRKAAAQSLSVVSSCFSAKQVSLSLTDKDESSIVRKIIAQVSKAFDTLSYARAIPELLTVVSSLVINITHIASETSSSSESLLMPLIVKIADLRIIKGFEHKEAADMMLAIAMRSLGPEIILKSLPLNLEPEARAAGLEPRAFLLPMLTHPHPSQLTHFVSYFVPLSEKMFDLQQKSEMEGRQSEAKVWSVLVGQVWAGLPGYCAGTSNLKYALTAPFAQLLSQLLYSQSELRPYILKALRVLVESNTSAGEVAANKLTVEQAEENIEYLQTQAESWLAVLFNVYGTVGRDSRNTIGEVIATWASIANEKDIHSTFLKVVQLFNTNLPLSQKAHFGNQDDIGNMTVTAQDIFVLLLPQLSQSDSQNLFELTMKREVLCCKDNGVQKRGYKILSKLVEGGKVTVDAEQVLRTLDDMIEGLTPAAKKDRFYLLSALIDQLPSTSLHVIPSLIPEIVLGTKEPSEKARTAAFEAILSMGRKMSKGGVVKRSMIDGMEEDGATDGKGSVEEFITMIAGGLAGASPHMISATVTAISRLVFEFKDVVSSNMLTEVLSTLLVFLSSANREIVKSVLGFVKLAVHTLPADLVRPHLKDLIPALLNWSHDHKNHFKLKVRHIFERMLRRFTWDEVYSCAGEEEASKVLVNIKKRKERAKRKRASRMNEDEGDDGPKVKSKAGDAFEDVLYGSESELDDSDDDVEAAAPSTSKKRHQKQEMRLKMDDDEPMDLLEGAATRVTSKLPLGGKSSRQRKPGQDASYFKTDDTTGKMVIDQEDSDEEGPQAGDASAGDAYHESLTSVDGFTRGPNGKVKFHKDTKKRRREEAQTEDVEMMDVGQVETPKNKKPKKKVEPKLGHEFKAKRAGGDVKKNGVDPYAYLSLSQAAKGRGRNSIGIAGKR